MEKFHNRYGKIPQPIWKNSTTDMEKFHNPFLYINNINNINKKKQDKTRGVLHTHKNNNPSQHGWQIAIYSSGECDRKDFRNFGKKGN